jgi:hypothetical protein
MTEIQILHNKNTKDKILEAAGILFSVKGFNGASVRDIASEAEVNVAAVNYHFNSKDNLFHQVMEKIFLESQSAIEQRQLNFPDEKVEDLAVWIFEYFNERADILRLVFKMKLSEKRPVCGKETFNKNGDEIDYGPPGGKAISGSIISELKHHVSEADMFWAVKMIFSTVIHLSLMHSNQFCKNDNQLGDNENSSYHDLKTLKSDIRRLVKIILKDLR